MEALWGPDLLKKLQELGVVPERCKSATIRIYNDEFVSVDVELYMEGRPDTVAKTFEGYIVKELSE